MNIITTQQELINKFTSEILKKRESIIQECIDKLQLESFDFSKLELVFKEGDEYEHLYYDKTIRVISIQKTPTIEYIYKDEDFILNNTKIEYSFKYY